MMFSWFRYTPTKPVVDPRDARIKELEEDKQFLLDRAKTAEALLEARNGQIAALEQINADQSSQNRKLFQRNMELATQLAPFTTRRKGAGGRFVSTKQTPQVLGTVVQA